MIRVVCMVTLCAFSLAIGYWAACILGSWVVQMYYAFLGWCLCDPRYQHIARRVRRRRIARWL
jgi:hypothetical protein